MIDLKTIQKNINANDFKNFECYEQRRLRIEETISHAQSRYDYGLEAGLDAVSINLSWSKVVAFRQSTVVGWYWKPLIIVLSSQE